LQVLCALLPGTLPFVFTVAKLDLTLPPGLFLAPPPFIPLQIRPLPVPAVVVPGQTVLLTVAPIVVPLPVAALFCLLTILCPSLLIQGTALFIILATLQLVLTFCQTALLLGLSSLFNQTLFFLRPPLIVATAALPFALAFRFSLALLIELPAVFLLALSQLFLVISLLFASLLFCQTPLLIGLTALGVLILLILAGLFGLTPLFPLLSLFSSLLFLTLAFGLVRLATLILGLTFVVTALLFGLASLLGFFVALISVLILLVLFRFPFFPSQATVFTVTGLLGTGKAGGPEEDR